MGNKKRWLKARERHRILIAEIKRIAGGSFIAALIVGPLIYFSVVAMPLDMRDEQAAIDGAATPEIDIAATPDVQLRTSSTPLPAPTVDPRTAKLIAKSRIKDLQLTPPADKFSPEVDEPVTTISGDLPEERELKFESFFGDQDAQIKAISIGEQTRENRMLVIENVIVDEGPAKIDKKDDAEKVAEKALQQYLRSEFKITDFRIAKDNTALDKNKRPYQLVLGDIKRNNGKWYVTYNQYSNALPVFDGNIKFIFTEGKKLLVISDNIKRDLPAETEFKIGRAVVEQNVKQVFEWDDSLDKIEFIDKGYFKGAPAYRAQTNAHNPAGNWEIFVEGVEGKVEDMTADIRQQDEPATPEPDTTEPATPEPDTDSTSEPEIVILDAIFSQILGKIYPQTPNDEPAIEPLAHSYAYTNEVQNITDSGGYFENPSMAWYTTFLDGPYVTVRDDDATSNIEITNQTPELPFTWDENSASLAAINAFYHTNKIRDYFAGNHGYEINKNIPLTVNSKLVDAYINGCGAWFNNSLKTIEMGRGGTESCSADLNYALGSDLVYHEYTHFVVEEVTHLPYILGSETAAMSEGLSDYFAATINNDPMWGDVIVPAKRRNLENTLNYQTDLNGQQHHDGMILSGALWDLRQSIGQEATDKLVFNTLFQDRYSFETFMYGMIIEDDDNGDFSDGTPHLAEIITAFDNHGIGPGIANFNGLPLTPEAWAELLEEELPEVEEEPILEALSGDCNGGSGALYIDVGNSCTITGGTYTYTTGTLYGPLYVTGGANVTFTSSVNVYDTGRVYETTSTSRLTINGSTILWSGSYFYVYQEAVANLASVYNYSGSVFQVGSANDGGTANLSGKLYVYGISRTMYDSLATYYNSVIVGSTATVYSTGSLTFSGRGTSTFSGNVDIQGTGGLLTVGSASIVDINAYLYVDSGGTLDVDSPGQLDVNYLYQGDSSGTPLGGSVQIQGDLDVIYSAYLYDGGDMTVSSTGNVTISSSWYIGDNADGVPAGGHVENSGTITVTLYTYIMENTGGTSEGDFDNNSGASFTTNRLYLGQSTYDGGDYANYDGGLTDITGYLYVYNDAYFWNAANYVVGTEGVLANYIRVEDGGWISTTTNSTIYQDYASGYVYLFNDALIENFGIFDIDGYLAMDQTINITEARRPEVMNRGTTYVASNVTMYDYSYISNGNATYAGTLDIEGSVNMYADSTFDNSLAGAYTGNVNIYDDLYMEGNSDFNNYASVILDDGGTDTGEVYLTGTATFTNEESGALLQSDDTNTTSTGLARVYNWATLANYGTLDLHQLIIGDSATATKGGTVTNESGGLMSVSTSGTAMTGTPTTTIYYGLLHNKSGAGSFYSYGLMQISCNDFGGFILNYSSNTNNFTTGATITGTTSGAKAKIHANADYGATGILTLTQIQGTFISGETISDSVTGVAVTSGTVYNGGYGFRQDDNSGYVGAITLLDNGRVDVGSGATLTIYGNGSDSIGNLNLSNDAAAFLNDGTTTVRGSMFLESDSQLINNSTLSVGTSTSNGDVTMPNGTSFLTNNSTVTVYDTLDTGGEPEDIAQGTLDNYSNFTISGTTTNKAILGDSFKINNYSGADFNINDVSGSDSDGILEAYASSVINNAGLFRARLIKIGTSTGSINGGNFYNTGSAEVRTYSGSTSNEAFEAEIDFADSSYINCYNNGNFQMQGGTLNATFDYNSTASSTCGLVANSRGTALINSGTDTAYSCVASETTTGYNGQIQISSGATLNCQFGNIGTGTNSAGQINNYGNLNITGASPFYVFEDLSNPDTTVELYNRSTGKLIANKLSLGNSSYDGGQVTNLAGDWTKDNDSPRFVATTLDLYANANFVNGTTTNHTAEVNWEVADTGKIITLKQDDNPEFINYGQVGGDIDISGLGGGASYGNFYNKSSSDVDAYSIIVRTEGRYTNEAGSFTDAWDTLTVYINGVFSNYATVNANKFRLGEITAALSGGIFWNYSGATLNVTGTGSDAAEIFQSGKLYQQASATALDIDGRLTMTGNSNSDVFKAKLTIADTSLSNTIQELYVQKNAVVDISENTSVPGNLNISGSSATDYGLVTIVHFLTGSPELNVGGTTTIQAYGELENNAKHASNAGFTGTGLVTVEANGTITSDMSSNFMFKDGLTTAGTVDMLDDVIADANSVSGNAIAVTGGVTTLGDSVGGYGGGSVDTTPVGGGDIVVSGGTFNSYSDLNIDGDLDVTGASTEAYFEDDTMTSNCQTSIHGYFDITSAATATINCETDPAVEVYSGSPGGNTQVEGTLIVNTNIETETMVIGDGVSATGTVTHDAVGCYGLTQAQCPNGWFPSASTVAVINVLDTLTINSNGTINVSEKSYHRPTYYDTNGRGGSYGGRGQHETSTYTAEYGNVTSWLDDFGMLGYSHYTYSLNTGMGSFTIHVGGTGGGIVNLTVGEDTDLTPDGILDTGTITFNNGFIFANGQNAPDGAGSGGSVNIKTHTITGIGGISANGGRAIGTPDPADEHTAGGGGRVYIEYDDKSAFTEVVLARGGYNDQASVKFAGTGTIFYKWTDKWKNQNDGTLVVDGANGTDTIDVDLDGNTSYADTADATHIPEYVDIESLQIDRYATVYYSEPSVGPPSIPVADIQQCIASNNGQLMLGGVADINYNRDSVSPAPRHTCVETPDPPETLYLNNSLTGAQSGQAGDESVSPPPSVFDLTPAISAVHEDAALDRTGITESPSHKAYKYEFLIGASVDDVWNDVALGTSGECYFSGNLTTGVLSGSRTNDIVVPISCGQFMSGDNTYYWKIRLLEDIDDNTGTTSDQYWGLWSDTNHFYIDEGAIIDLDVCNTISDRFQIGPFDTETGTNYLSDYCTFDTDATVPTDIQVNKDGYLTYTSGTEIITDMVTTDYDLISPGLDGFGQISVPRNEAGFYVSHFNTGTFAVGRPDPIGNPTVYYNTHYSLLGTSPITILTSSGGYSNESLRIYIGAFVHGLLNSSNPTISYPVNYCSTTQTPPCITKPTTDLLGYEAIFTITATPTP